MINVEYICARIDVTYKKSKVFMDVTYYPRVDRVTINEDHEEGVAFDTTLDSTIARSKAIQLAIKFVKSYKLNNP